MNSPIHSDSVTVIHIYVWSSIRW